MINKRIFIFFIFIAASSILFSEIQVVFDYKNIRYNLRPIENKEYKIEMFDAVKEVDQPLKHRIMLSTLEKSKLFSLFYVGDKYEFNSIEIMLVDLNKYQITYKTTGIKIIFSIGEYDSIVLHSALNFGEKEIDKVDKIASSLTIKILLKMLTGIIEKKESFKSSININDTKIIEEYNDFLNQLKKLSRQEIFNYLKNYIDINFQITGKKNIKEDWIHPAKLYFYKSGDYKSFALFYYYTLQKLGFKVRSYFVSDLIRKQKNDLDDMYELFSKKYKDNKDLEDIRILESEYHHINSSTNLTSFINTFKTDKHGQPPAVYFYYPPDFDSAAFIVAFELNDRWLYTTGENWIDAGIYTPERVCDHYTRGGCYYSYIMNDMILLNNQPIIEDSIEWDIFFSAD